MFVPATTTKQSQITVYECDYATHRADFREERGHTGHENTPTGCDERPHARRRLNRTQSECQRFD